jgi:4-hydroxybenzoate polyprenyltransferase
LITTGRIVRESSSHLYYRISRIPFLIVSSSVLVSLTGSMVLLLSFILHGMPLDTPLLVAAFALTFALYNLDRAVKQKEDLVNDPERSKLFMGRRRTWAIIGVGSLAASVSLGARESVGVMLTLLSPLTVYAGYSIGLPLMPRIKDIPGVKNLVLVGTWAIIPTVLPNVCASCTLSRNGMILSLAIFYFIFTKIMINSILFDVRDLRGDSASGIRTIPVILGVRSVRGLLVLLNATLVLWAAVCWFLGYFPRYLPILVVNVLYGFWYILFFTTNISRKRILVDLLVDGEWIPLGLTVALVYMLS